MSSNSISKRIKRESDTGTGIKLGCIDDIADADSTSATSDSNSIITEDEPNSLVNVFTDDILPDIMDNLEILTVKDLLNLRLVNRCWRNAATSVLLKRNLCEIGLDFGEVVPYKDDNAVGQVMQTQTFTYNPNGNNIESISPSYKYFNVYKPRRGLSDLIQLISASPKFPSTSIRFYSECCRGFGNLCPISEYNKEKQQHQIDLLHFFSIYGKKIKRLSLSCNVSKTAAVNLLYVHMPHLICLDLEGFENFLVQDEEESLPQVCLPLPSTLEIREIVLGHQPTFLRTKSDVVKKLIIACPKLSSIRNVDASAVSVLLQMGKCHLVKDLYISPILCDFLTIHRILKPLMLNHKLSSLKLSKLTFQLSNIKTYFLRYQIVVAFLNLILSASRDSLRYLELFMNSSRSLFNIFVPPLPQLQRLYLADDHMKGTTRFYFSGDIVGQLEEAGQVSATQLENNFDTLQNYGGNSKIPAGYFQRLREVTLYTGKIIRTDSDKLLDFFSLDHLGPDGATIISGDVLPTVTTLVVSPWGGYDSTLSKLFPNVVSLEISVNNSDVLRNWVWTAFSKLVRFKISATGSVWSTKIVDSFFTGIFQEVCSTFDAEATAATDLESGAAQVPERTQPYIGDCKNLMEFEFNFLEKLNSKFASKLTAVHGFKSVIHRTKIVFSFEEVDLSKKEIEKTFQNLDPVAAYVEIRNYKPLL